jgi:hypothetical protein
MPEPVTLLAPQAGKRAPVDRGELLKRIANIESDLYLEEVKALVDAIEFNGGSASPAEEFLRGFSSITLADA